MQTFYGDKPMPEDLENAVVFAAEGAMHIKIQWIRTDTKRAILEVVKDIIDNEDRCLTPLFFTNSEDSPFLKASKQITQIIHENHE